MANPSSKPHQLGFDIWSLICSKLYDTSGKRDLVNICRVSQFLNSVGAPFLYRSIDLDFSLTEIPWAAVVLRVLVHRRPHYMHFVLELTADIGDKPPRRNGSTNELVRTMVTQLMTLIPKLPYLQRFRWNSYDTVPGHVVSNLTAHPTLREMHVQFFDEGPEGLCIPEELYRNSKLVSISGKYSHLSINDTTGMQNRAKLHHLLFSCPNIKSLDIVLTDGNTRLDGLEVNQAQILLFSNYKPKTLLKLEDLSLESYGFANPGNIQSHCTFDARHLRRLSLKNCDIIHPFFDYLRSQSLELKVFKLESPSPHHDPRLACSLRKLLTSFTGLEKLELLNADLVNIVPGVIKHANTLRYLKIDQTEVGEGFYLDPISSKEIRQILDCCHCLEELHIFVDRDVLEEICTPSSLAYCDWLWPVQGSLSVESLKRITTLRKIFLHTPLVDNSLSRELLTPLVDVPFAKIVAGRVWSPSLEVLEIVCGEAPHSPAWSLHEEMRSHWVVRKDMNNEFTVADGLLKEKKDMYARWEKILGKPIIPPQGLVQRSIWEENMLKSVTMAAARAPNRLSCAFEKKNRT